MTKEDRYIRRRLRQARRQARAFYRCRTYPIDRHKIVFCNIEGTVGYGCNPKYICEELRRRNALRRARGEQPYDLVWLVDDTSLPFPDDVRVVSNTLAHRAYELSTAAVWVDNSRKQLEVRKRPGQFYVQTWHASLSPKPIGLQRGASFSKIAYLVSKHDADMTDLVLTNSRWMEDVVLHDGLLYDGAYVRTGSPRNDILVNDRTECRRRLRQNYGIPDGTQLLMYAPTFRSGSQGTVRSIEKNNKMPDFEAVCQALHDGLGGTWKILLRLHPQLTARHITGGVTSENVIDVSGEADMFETLAACDALLTDYSATMFDAAFMHVPVFLYAYDLQAYIAERGQLLWPDLEGLPFPVAKTEESLLAAIREFDPAPYQESLEAFLQEAELREDGHSAERAVDVIEEHLARGRSSKPCAETGTPFARSVQSSPSACTISQRISSTLRS